MSFELQVGASSTPGTSDELCHFVCRDGAWAGGGCAGWSSPEPWGLTSEGQPWLQEPSMAAMTQPTQGLASARGQHWHVLSEACGASPAAGLALGTLAAATLTLVSTSGSLQ